MDEREHYLQMRRAYSIQGWALLVYFILMNVVVIAAMVIGEVIGMIQYIWQGGSLELMLSDQVMDQLMEMSMSFSAWGYLVTIVIGSGILLLWKKPKFCFGTLWQKGKPMTLGSFFGILSVFLSAQLVFSLLSTLAELFLNQFGLSLTDSTTEELLSMDSLGMFLYVGLGAPISEEILFRGLVQRSMEPYGKKFSIFASALLFGLYHGNLTQTPFAFVVGLVLGYVAVEYNIGWAMVLHMINNLLLSDTLTRLTSYLPAPWGDALIWAILAFFTFAALIVLIVKRKNIGAYLRSERTNPACFKAFFCAPGIIVLTVILLLTIAATTFMTLLGLA